ncbi:MAG: DUF5522 domain-containing protein [Aureispira sp.]
MFGFLKNKKADNEKQRTNQEAAESLVEGRDFYIENGFYVFTEYYHLKRGYCCGNGCKHCAYKKK